MVARHTEQKRNVFRRMHVAAIKKLVDEKLTLAGDSKLSLFPEQWRIGYEIGQKHLADDIRAILGAPPKGYSDIEPTLSTKAKNRYLDWREMQAKGEWKKLSAEEQARWETYVTDNVPFEKIRADEMAREEDLYEYAMETTSHGIVHSVFDREWDTLEVAQERVARYTDSWKRMGRSEYVSAKLVKRRKAGKVEDV